MNTRASCTLPNEEAPFAQQMRMLTEMADYAMRMARVAVEQYEASVAAERALTMAPTADAAATRPRRLPCPGSLFIRAARVVQNCIVGYSRLAAGLPIARLSPPRPSTRDAATPTPMAEQSRAEPVRQALRSVTRNHPHGTKLLRTALENLAAALTADPRSNSALPDLFRRVCNETGIRLNPAQERKAARDLTCQIRAAPA